MPKLAPIAESPTTLQLMERYTAISDELDKISWSSARAVDLIELRRAIRNELKRRLTESGGRP